MKVIINLGRGNLQCGCHDVAVQILDGDRRCLQQLSGSLPAAPKLAELYQQWRAGYLAFYQDKAMRIGLMEPEGTRYSDADFRALCQQITQEFNDWLTGNSFAPIEKALRSNLDPQQSVQVIITATDLVLQQLPWHLWNFIEDYHNAEIAFSPLNWKKAKQSRTERSQVRILSILGNNEGIDLLPDLESLTILPQAELIVLVEPSLRKLNECLWQPEGWDILLFSGHSYTHLETGYIYLNASENITIAQLKNSLGKAIANGLQIAIFNSCEGMALALGIADLSLPYGVVMSKLVPDLVAQGFLKYFLTAFARGKNFALAVKEARSKLAGWETEYICASWLPAIWQNPATDPLYWSDLQFVPPPKKSRRSLKILFLASLIVSAAMMVGRSLSLFEPLELWTYDRLLQKRPPETIDPRILVVEITDDDSDRYPISDKSLVEAINILEQHQPAAIGIDIHRAESRGTEYQALIRSIESNPRLFPVCAYGSSNQNYAPPKGLTETKLKQQMGFSDLLVDGQTGANNHALSSTMADLGTNSKVRRHLLSYDPNLASSTSKCLTPYSLSFQLAYEYLHQAGIKPLTVNDRQQWQFGNVVFQEMTDKFGGYQQLNDLSSQIALNYRSGRPGKRISLNQLLSGKIQSQSIANRIILMGYSASVARDYFETPYGTMPGVWIHAHMTSQIISSVLDGRSLIWVLPQWGDWLLILSWSILAGVVTLVLRKQPVVCSLLALIILIVAMEQFCLAILVKGGWLPYVPTFLSMSIVSGVMVNNRQQLSLLERSS